LGIADGMVSEVVCAFSFGHAAMPFVGYRVVYAVETGPPQDRSSWDGSSNVLHALR
jgi:hypothetical protein